MRSERAAHRQRVRRRCAPTCFRAPLPTRRRPGKASSASAPCTSTCACVTELPLRCRTSRH